MADVWILVADGSQARIYAARHRRGPYELVTSLAHEASRLHARDLGTDVPGRVHDRFGPARHSLEGSHQLKNEEKQRFAREIAALLADGLRQKKYVELVVMAGPAFLGILRESFTRPVAAAIVAEVDKDLVAQDEATIRENVP